MMLKIWLIVLPIWLLIIVCCTEPEPTPSPLVILPATPTAAPTSLPSATLTPTVTFEPIPPPTPAPVSESRWECYQGGVACYQNIYDVSMLNAQEGWAVGYDGVVLHYTTPPDGGEPTWQQVHRVSSLDVFYAISAISPNEWWGVNGGILIHYKNGEVETFVFPGVLSNCLTWLLFSQMMSGRLGHRED